MSIQLGQERSRAPFNVPAVISAQAFEGFWEDEAALNGPRVKWSRVTIPGLDAIADRGLQNRIRATVAAVAMLQTGAADSRVVWDLVAVKGLDWLRKINPDVKWEDVVAAVAAMLRW
jgi:hypothetical protein